MKLFGVTCHFLLPMIILVGLVGALDVAVWKVRAPLSDQQQREPANRQEATSNEPPQTPASERQDPQTPNQAGRPGQQPPHWYSFLADADWVLTIVGGLTFLIVGWQAYETRLAAIASTRSVEQSERQFQLLHQQWVDTSDFTCEVANEPHRGFRRVWIVRFKVSNNTALPLTVNSIDCYADGSTTTLWPRKTIPPQRHRRMHFLLPLGEQSNGIYDQLNPVPLQVAGKIDFTDAFKKAQIQMFAKVGVYEGRKRPDRSRSRLIDEPGNLSELIAKLEATAQRDDEDEKGKS